MLELATPLCDPILLWSEELGILRNFYFDHPNARGHTTVYKVETRSFKRVSNAFISEQHRT